MGIAFGNVLTVDRFFELSRRIDGGVAKLVEKGWNVRVAKGRELG